MSEKRVNVQKIPDTKNADLVPVVYDVSSVTSHYYKTNLRIIACIKMAATHCKWQVVRCSIVFFWGGGAALLFPESHS
jgi:hypothetical protein